MKRILGLLTVLILLLSGCARGVEVVNGGGEPVNSITPLMWRVTSPDGQTMYLFGSIHAADDTIYPLPDFIMDAFNQSGYLAVEFDLVAAERDLSAVLAMSFRMMYTDGRTIADDIGIELHERASAVLAQLGVPQGFYDSFKPNFWMTLMMLAALEEAGMSAEYGLDAHFLNLAHERGMGILEVESMEEQLNVLMGFSVELQTLLLENSLDIEQAALGLRLLYDTWKRGDEAAINALLNAENEAMPAHLAQEYNYAMMLNRDINMTAAARRYMAEGKQVFFVVGLAHLVGEDSVVDLLRRYGYEVVRVEG